MGLSSGPPGRQPALPACRAARRRSVLRLRRRPWSLDVSGHSTRSVGHEMSVSSAENAFAVKLFRRLPRRYDVLAEVLSFGQNARWRAELVRHVVAGQPQRVLDVATGTAGVAIAVARQCDARITGVDVSEEMLEIGRRRIEVAGLGGRVELEAARAEELSFADETFDAVTFTYVLRYVGDPEATIAELARTLRGGGVMAGLVGRGSLPRSQHLRPLPPPAAPAVARGVGGRGHGGRRMPCHEPGRRDRDVGAEACLRRWRPRTTPRSDAAGAAMCGRCCIRRIRPGISLMSSLARASRPG